MQALDASLTGRRKLVQAFAGVTGEAGEPVGDLMAPAKLAETAFMPCYGMAEAVLLVSSRPPRTSLRVSTAPSGVPAISLGKPVTGFTVRVSGKDGQPCADGELGEIQLAGGTLAVSYFGSGTTLADPDGFYRTGDIGFLHDGELFVTGRISDHNWHFVHFVDALDYLFRVSVAIATLAFRTYGVARPGSPRPPFPIPAGVSGEDGFHDHGLFTAQFTGNNP